MTVNHLRKLEAYEAANRECAAIILADVAKYGGEGALLVQWARTIVQRSASPATDPQPFVEDAA
jgi:hypothetical protein